MEDKKIDFSRYRRTAESEEVARQQGQSQNEREAPHIF
jgi:hypothetical protein